MSLVKVLSFLRILAKFWEMIFGKTVRNHPRARLIRSGWWVYTPPATLPYRRLFLNFRAILPIFSASILLVSCSSPNIDNNVNLEGTAINDSSLAFPQEFLLSAQGAPSDSLKLVPVVVSMHGFSASTYEWEEFRNYLDSVGGARMSLPLLGGHGRDYADFKKATWQDWQSGPLNEYDSLVALGYKNLSITCSSTGCPLLVDAMATGWFDSRPAPQEVIMIDPIIFSSAKLLTLAEIVGPFLGNVETDCTEVEKGHWYCNRPAAALEQLMTLLTHVRKQLEDGVRAPAGTKIVVYKAKHDESADPVSALALYKGLRNGDNSNIVVHMVNSSTHVFTRSNGRASWSPAQRALQLQTFADMKALLAP